MRLGIYETTEGTEREPQRAQRDTQRARRGNHREHEEIHRGYRGDSRLHLDGV